MLQTFSIVPAKIKYGRAMPGVLENRQKTPTAQDGFEFVNSLNDSSCHSVDLLSLRGVYEGC